MAIDQRQALDALIRERREDYVSLSRLIGRNAAYIQQFIRRGSPRKLDEDDRRTLARYFGVPESALGAPPPPPAPIKVGGMIAVPQLAIGASAGPGALPGDERPRARLAFSKEQIRALGAHRPEALTLVQVEGDSMEPSLSNGDDILVDASQSLPPLRDGIYVLRMEDAIMVKRLALNPATRRLAIKSDNPAYPSWDDIAPDAVEVIGRVIWAGRKVG